MKHDSGFAADRILMTLPPKHEIVSARGFFLGKTVVLQRTSEPGLSWCLPFSSPTLSMGLRSADGI